MVGEVRCEWVGDDPLMIKYHDKEWGVPVHDDTRLFELIILEGAQAGLSWSTILKRREGYRKAFDNFDVSLISKYDSMKKKELIGNEKIIRNKLKIEAAIINAQKFLEVQKEFGSFDKYIWRFVDYKTIKNKFEKLLEYPAATPESDKMSKDLKKRGFKFVGSTICYAFMQSVGMVNDHSIHCFRHKNVEKIKLENNINFI